MSYYNLVLKNEHVKSWDIYFIKQIRAINQACFSEIK